MRRQEDERAVGSGSGTGPERRGDGPGAPVRASSADAPPGSSSGGAPGVSGLGGGTGPDDADAACAEVGPTRGAADRLDPGRDGAGSAPDRSGDAAASLPEPLRTLVGRIGETPLVPLPSPEGGGRIVGKAEWLNPGGSVKDRPAWSMVREAMVDGRLEGRRLLDASSGNTAIAYAMLGAAGGFGVTLCVPESASRERVRTLRAYGAELEVTDPMEGSDGAIRRARELAEAAPGRFWYADQYSNAANSRAHYRGTGPEIWRELGEQLTHLVVGLGTSGTLMGTARFLRERNPALTVVAVEPAEPMHGIEGLKHMETAIRPSIYDEGLPDRHLGVATEAAQEATRELARDSGLFVGVSSGAAWVAARRVATEAGPDATVATILPDGGGRYLDEPWWSP